MRILFFVSMLILFHSGLKADPPGAGPPVRTSTYDIANQWDTMAPAARQQALIDDFNASDPFMWASLTRSQQAQKISEMTGLLNKMTRDQRRQFMALSAGDRQQVLYGFYSQKQSPGDALKQVRQENDQDTYSFSPP